jgi:hypothetical protein
LGEVKSWLFENLAAVYNNGDVYLLDLSQEKLLKTYSWKHKEPFFSKPLAIDNFLFIYENPIMFKVDLSVGP